VVARSVAEGLAGLECLSGIPGLAGATPIQKSGATARKSPDIAQVRAYDRTSRKILNIPNDQCGFAYRTSKFRMAPAGLPPPGAWGGTGGGSPRERGGLGGGLPPEATPC